MSSHYSFRLSSIDTFQLLDALFARAEKWERPIAYEANDETETAEEALQIASHYRQIISLIEKQMKEQRHI